MGFYHNAYPRSISLVVGLVWVSVLSCPFTTPLTWRIPFRTTRVGCEATTCSSLGRNMFEEQSDKMVLRQQPGSGCLAANLPETRWPIFCSEMRHPLASKILNNVQFSTTRFFRLTFKISGRPPGVLRLPSAFGTRGHPYQPSRTS